MTTTMANSYVNKGGWQSFSVLSAAGNRTADCGGVEVGHERKLVRYESTTPEMRFTKEVARSSESAYFLR